MTKKVLNVSEVNLEVQKTNPPRLVIHAKGEVTTGGWSNGRLIQYIYIVPPADGMYEFDFVADPPSGITPQVISPINAEPFVWDNFPKELTGVRVYASSNQKEAKLP